MTDLIQLIYSSQPFGFDEAILSGILLDARRCNQRDGVTGALICRHDIYLQYLEGPAAAVTAAYGRIARDDRHLEVTQHLSQPITARLFGDWAMLHDPAQSWIWSENALHNGILDTLPAQTLCEVFQTLASQAPPQQQG